MANVIVNIDQMKTSQNKIRKTQTNTNTSLADFREQLEGLALNKYCQNKWRYYDGKCYYFSPPAQTLTWTEAQV